MRRFGRIAFWLMAISGTVSIGLLACDAAATSDKATHIERCNCYRRGFTDGLKAAAESRLVEVAR